MLSYFESEHNAREYLAEKLQKEFSQLEINELAKNLSVDMQAAREYYRAAQNVSPLTRPLLIYYGMVNLAKVLHIASKGEAPEGKKHGLKTVKPWNLILAELSVKIKQYGIFPEFYHCYSNEDIHAASFSLKQLFSQVPELKIAFETVYKEKSLSLKVIRVRHGISIVDSELKKYEKLEESIRKIPEVALRFHKDIQMFENHAVLFLVNRETRNPLIRALSGEEFLVLPILHTNGTCVVLPELSTHFLIMFMLGMTARYHPKIWADAIKGQESGDIYIIQNFLDVTARKFPNLILNELRNRQFFFGTPKIEAEKELTDQQLEDIYEFVNRKMAQSLRGY
jgi:hypothetical protein